MTGIEVVLFDLDDTLFAHSAAVRAGVLARRTLLGLEGDEAAEFARWTALEELHYHRYLSGETGFWEQRRDRARGFVEPLGIALDDPAADAWFGDYLVEYKAAWQLHDDALPLLNALPHRLGIVTNAELSFQLEKIDALGIRERFEHIVASGEVGAAKPDARIFAHAASLFDVAPAAAAYVGDRLHTDAIGAANAGLRGIWLNRSGIVTDEQRAEAASTDVVIVETLDQVPAALRD